MPEYRIHLILKQWFLATCCSKSVVRLGVRKQTVQYLKLLIWYVSIYDPAAKLKKLISLRI